MKRSILLIPLVLFLSCNQDKMLERRITALERRVAALEEEKPAATTGTSTDNPGKVQQAGINAVPVDNSSNPVIRFEKAEYDFGRVPEGEVIEHIYKFMNSGKGTLVIHKATASCGCTVPTWPRDPIPSGGNGEIKVRFDTKGRPNQQIKTVTIEANTEPALTKLQIKGYVIPKTQTTGPVKN